MGSNIAPVKIVDRNSFRSILTLTVSLAISRPCGGATLGHRERDTSTAKPDSYMPANISIVQPPSRPLQIGSRPVSMATHDVPYSTYGGAPGTLASGDIRLPCCRKMTWPGLRYQQFGVSSGKIALQNPGQTDLSTRHVTRLGTESSIAGLAPRLAAGGTAAVTAKQHGLLDCDHVLAAR